MAFSTRVSTEATRATVGFEKQGVKRYWRGGPGQWPERAPRARQGANGRGEGLSEGGVVEWFGGGEWAGGEVVVFGKEQAGDPGHNHLLLCWWSIKARSSLVGAFFSPEKGCIWASYVSRKHPGASPSPPFSPAPHGSGTSQIQNPPPVPPPPCSLLFFGKEERDKESLQSSRASVALQVSMQIHPSLHSKSLRSLLFLFCSFPFLFCERLRFCVSLFELPEDSRTLWQLIESPSSALSSHIQPNLLLQKPDRDTGAKPNEEGINTNNINNNNKRNSVFGQQAFKTEPRNLTVRVGSMALLKCEVLRASGTVQWVKDGLLLGPQRSLPGHPRYSMTGNEERGQYYLQIQDVHLEDDSPYECQVGRSKTSRPIVSRTVWLNVQIPPSEPYFDLDTEEPWVEGNEYTVTCIAPDAKPAADVFLFKDGEELTDKDSYTMSGSEKKLLNSHAEVQVRAQRLDNGRPLLCRIKNPAISRPLETNIIMKVYFPPQAPVIEGLRSEEVKAGTSLRLVCVSYGGNPLATLHWTKNGSVLSSSWEVDTITQKSSSVLNMEVKAEDNKAILCCESVNQVSRSPLSISRTLTVLFEPAQVRLLGSFKAVEGKEVSLCCYTSTSNPPVHIRWWLGFKELNNATVTISEGENGGMTTMSNLTHTVSREENGLPLTCEAFNKGTRFSKVQSETLSVYYPPQKVWLEAPVAGTPLRSGTTIRLVCFSSGGNPTGRLTWLKNNKVVQLSSSHVHSERGVSRELLLSLQPSDNLATYRCDATNEARKVQSAETKLSVQFPAVSVKIVAKQDELRAGHTLSLECLAGSSNPKVNISWSLGSTRLDGVEQAPEKAEFGGVSVTSKLTLPLSSHHHSNRITCQAFSSLLSEGVNTFYTLNVLFPPEFAEEQPTMIETTEDDMVTLPVLVSANPDQISCEWHFQGEKMVKERDHRYQFPEGWALEIWNVTRRDAGSYRVECSNAEGKQSAIIKLDVYYAPSVKMKMDPVFVNVGDTADLMCEADANPIDHGMFSWKWRGDGEVEELGEESQHGASGLLTLYEVTRSRAGPYQCTVDNGIAPPAHVVGQLIVRFAPVLHKGAQWRKVASRGDGSTDVDVLCQAEGVPRVSFTWAKNGVPLDFGNPRYMERTVREGVVHTSTLTVVNVSAALDYAIFTCTAHNNQGEDSLDIQLLSTSYPDPPSDLKVLSISSTSVTLEWMPGFDGGLTQNFRVRYRWVGSASHLYVDVYPPRATVYKVTGLLHSTTYNFSVNAINSIGESSYADNGAVLTITTMGPEIVSTEHGPKVPDATEVSYLPVYAIVLLIGGLLLLLNALGFFLFVWRKKGRGLKKNAGRVLEGKKSESEGSSVSSSSRYTSREKINISAQKTLLIDTSSEPDSSGSIYETYGGESYHYYYPTEAYRQALYPHPEGPEGAEENGTRHGLNPLTHDYEEVRDWRPYEDLLTSTLPPLQGFGLDRQGRTPLPTYHEDGLRGPAGLDLANTSYNSVAYRRRKDSDLPFELRGELV
ncbi:nephrin [Hoplias malabaricus]|uniref:nephrin n=1 Tax=Hoplias malabaricus TaxID=27720 RepID=UPI003461C343